MDGLPRRKRALHGAADKSPDVGVSQRGRRAPPLAWTRHRSAPGSSPCCAPGRSARSDTLAKPIQGRSEADLGADLGRPLSAPPAWRHHCGANQARGAALSFISSQADFLVSAHFVPSCCPTATINSRERKENKGGVKVSVDRRDPVLLTSRGLTQLSTVLAGYRDLKSSFRRFPTAKTPGVAELSCVEPYWSRCVESSMSHPSSVASLHPSSVASQLRRLRTRAEASASVCSRRVADQTAGVPAYRLIDPSVASAWQLSPRIALAPTMRALRRSALAQRCTRIAGRIARLAGSGRRRLQ
jgi:hypothetical protein